MSGQVELLGGEGDIWYVSSPSACPATGLECSPPGDSWSCSQGAAVDCSGLGAGKNIFLSANF